MCTFWPFVFLSITALNLDEPVVQMEESEPKEAPKEKRFVEVSNEELDDIESNTISTRTKAQTKWAVKTIKGGFSYFNTPIWLNIMF